MHPERILVIGAGATGAAVAHDLALRGLPVTVVDRGPLVGATSSLHHGLVHSGARYVLVDPASARECARESAVLRRIAPGSVRDTGGLVIALGEDEASLEAMFLSACRDCGIATEPIGPREAAVLEPGLAPALVVVRVPDGTTEPAELPRRFLATARTNGAELLPSSPVERLLVEDGSVRGACLAGGRELTAEIVVNAAGPWSEALAGTGGARAPVQLSAGVMVALEGELCGSVLNRLRPPGDGDLVVPRGGRTVAGTSSFPVADPDEPAVTAAQLEALLRAAAELLPGVARARVAAAWAAVRPLLDERPDVTGREISRTFRCIDHGEADGVEGLVTIGGGKATTARAMAEAAADLVCAKLGVSSRCRTREVELARAELPPA